MTVEIYDDLPFADYQAIDALNPSLIKIGCHKSMKHLRWSMENQPAPTEAMILGELSHCAVFEWPELANRFHVFDGRRDTRTTVYQEAVEAAGKKKIVKSQDLRTATEMGLAVASDPLVKPLIKRGKSEVSLTTEEHGLPCKGRLDWICSGQGFCDLKTCRDIRAFAFGSDFYKYGYDISLGLYQRWLQLLRNQPEPCFVLCVEKDPPFDVAVVPIPQAVLDQGAEKGLRVVEQYRQCQEKNEWPGIAGGEEYWLHVPQWAVAEDDVDWS